MERYSSFAHSNAVCAAMILGLLICCPYAPAQVTKAKKEFHPPPPEILKIGQGMKPLSLTGPILVAPGGQGPDFGDEQTQGAWAAKTIERITGGITPSKSELERFASKDDLTAGEGLADDTFRSQMQPTHVRRSSVIFELPITWSETGLQDLSLGEVGCSPSSPVCVGATSYADGAVGVYGARVEVCLAPSDHTKLKRVKDKDEGDIKCATADGVPGNDGFWYDVSEDPWTYAYLTAPSLSRLFSNETNSWDWFAPQPKGETDGTFSIPVDLPVPVNSIRVEIELGLKNPHGSAEKGISSWVYGNPLPGDPYVKTDWGGKTFTTSSGAAGVAPAGGPELIVTRFAIQLQSITVLPAAFLAMKVLPYTILYRPPGDRSQGTFTTTESYGTSLTTGQNTSIDNTAAFMDSTNVTNNMKISLLIASIQAQDSQSSSGTSGIDNNSTVGTGLVTSNSHSKVRAWQLGTGNSGSPDPTISPAQQFVTPNTCTTMNYTASGCKVNLGETYSQEPFWADRIVVLLNPTAELWDFKAGTKMQLLGAEDYDAISIRDLTACAQYSGKYGWTLATGSKLTPKECLDLLSLDPYYLAGQSFDPSKSSRGVSVGGGNYGNDPRSPTSTWLTTSFQELFTNTATQSTNVSASYLASVTNVIGFSWSDGMTLSPNYSYHGLDVGISDGTTVTQGNQNTTGTQMKVTYAASTAAADTGATQISGGFEDDHDFDTPACQKKPVECYTPQVKVYIDELFGSYMFSDPDAPLNPLLPVHPKIPAPVKLK